MQATKKAFLDVLETVSKQTTDTGAAVQAAATLVLASRLHNTIDLRVEFDNKLEMDANLEARDLGTIHVESD